MSYKNFTKEQAEPFWEFHCINAYLPLESTEGWLECNGCGQHPRVWLFDNGRYATCLCFEKYDKNRPAVAESIMSVYKRTGMTKEYKSDDLRLNWNKYVETGEFQDKSKLGEGRW
jgi:hypothetical protein